MRRLATRRGARVQASLGAMAARRHRCLSRLGGPHRELRISLEGPIVRPRLHAIAAHGHQHKATNTEEPSAFTARKRGTSYRFTEQRQGDPQAWALAHRCPPCRWAYLLTRLRLTVHSRHVCSRLRRHRSFVCGARLAAESKMDRRCLSGIASAEVSSWQPKVARSLSRKPFTIPEVLKYT